MKACILSPLKCGASPLVCELGRKHPQSFGSVSCGHRATGVRGLATTPFLQSEATSRQLASYICRFCRTSDWVAVQCARTFRVQESRASGCVESEERTHGTSRAGRALDDTSKVHTVTEHAGRQTGIMQHVSNSKRITVVLSWIGYETRGVRV